MSNNYKIIDADSVEQTFRSTEAFGVHTPHHFVTGTVDTGALTDVELRATPVPISGTVSTGALTDVELRATPVEISGALTDSELRANPVPVSGTVSTGGLTDTQLRATAINVAGPLTDVQLRLTPVPISGALTDTQLRATPVSVDTGGLTNAQLRASAVSVSVSGTVSTGALTDTQLRATPVTVTGPLTDAQLRATALPISGTVSTGALTDTQLRATPVPVDTGGLTNTQLRATPVLVSGGLTNTELRATPVPVSTGGLTDTQLRATPIPISGTVSTGGLTDTQLRATPVWTKSIMGEGDITTDAWGIQKISLPQSLFRGIWTHDISPKTWFMYENGVQVYTSTNITSTLGAARLNATSTASTLILESRMSPRYQPNRGHLFSTALWCPTKTANGIREWGLQTAENGVFFRLKVDGKLYAVRKSGGVINYEAEIDTSSIAGFDVEKGNVYDIQYQWRGVGNYKFFINLKLVHTIASLGTLTALSMENPALPASFRATRTTQDVIMNVGCCDITSENGLDDTRQYTSAAVDGLSINGTNVPVLTIYNPLQINGTTNTRAIFLNTLSINSNKKGTYKLWRTRNPGLITGEVLVALGNGSFVQTDSMTMSAGATKATAATVASMEYIGAVYVEANIPKLEQISYTNTEVSLVRGDYLVITSTTATAVADHVLTWGEEV